MNSITFLGAAGEVTGSSYLLNCGDYDVLIDLGMFQGTPEIEALNFQRLEVDPKRLAAVFLTHAHLDHCGRLPLINYLGFDGPIFMTPPTQDLIEIVLHDSARISEFNYKRGELDRPLYNKLDVDEILRLVKPVDFHQKFSFKDLDVEYIRSGHIIGAGSIKITQGDKSIIFSGDLGHSPERIVQDMEYFSQADRVVMESTYGGRVHPDEDVEQMFANEINEIEKHQSVLMIPAFSLERTQVVLRILRKLKAEGKIHNDTIAFLDSPMAIKATKVYRRYSHLHNKTVQEDSAASGDPFFFPGLEVTRKGWESRQILDREGAKIIVAGSGMMAGGRIMKHAKHYLADPINRLLIVGYQAEETAGRAIVEGAKEVEIDGEWVPVNAHLTRIMSMSAHADEPHLLEWLDHIQGVKEVFLTHGDPEGRAALSEKIKQRGITVHRPGHREQIEFLISS